MIIPHIIRLYKVDEFSFYKYGFVFTENVRLV